MDSSLIVQHEFSARGPTTPWWQAGCLPRGSFTARDLKKMKTRDSIQSQGARRNLILGPSLLHILYIYLFRCETIANVAFHKLIIFDLCKLIVKPVKNSREHDPFLE